MVAAWSPFACAEPEEAHLVLSIWTLCLCCSLRNLSGMIVLSDSAYVGPKVKKELDKGVAWGVNVAQQSDTMPFEAMSGRKLEAKDGWRYKVAGEKLCPLGCPLEGVVGAVCHIWGRRCIFCEVSSACGSVQCSSVWPETKRGGRKSSAWPSLGTSNRKYVRTAHVHWSMGLALHTTQGSSAKPQ